MWLFDNSWILYLPSNTVMVIMVAFYNNHMNFYSNYTEMLIRWIYVGWTTFVWTWPLRPSVLISVPLLGQILKLGYLAFCRENNQVDRNKKEGA